MSTGIISGNISVGGVSTTFSLSRTGSGLVFQDPVLAAGQAGVLTRSDANTGVATLSTGHGIVSLDLVDVYWAGGVRYGLTATVATNAVTVDGGAGDDLPAAAAMPVVVCKQVVLDVDFDADLLAMLVATADQRCHLEFIDDSAASVLAVDKPAGEPWWFVADNGYTNPLAGHVVGSIKVSNGGVVPTTLYVVGPYDSDE